MILDASVELLLAPRMSERPTCIEHLIDWFNPRYEHHIDYDSTTTHNGTDVEGKPETIRPKAV
jgi:hypothetical protein